MNFSKEIMLKIFDLLKEGYSVTFEEDLGKGTITVYVGNRHTHCGYPEANNEELIKSIYETLVEGKGLSFCIPIDTEDFIYK